MNFSDYLNNALKKSTNMLKGNNNNKKSTTSKQSNNSSNLNNYYVPTTTYKNNNNNLNKSTNSNINKQSTNSKPKISNQVQVEPRVDIDALLSEKRQYTALKQNISNISTYLNTCIKNLEKPSELIKSSYTINGNSVDGGNFKKIRQELIDNKNLLNTILDEIDKKIIEINGVIQ